ncbi:hypothetical protein SELMODRAFT_425001 [Selaginella moellendorffii]|uniref:Fido domain-containing protein n=1 Tax=Selaginella moellendorffii TaxID=88036 RepID=D8SRP9_SELML|nr:hypothetical protein SELMODRAFT_425001 [Selaginella moellendorffii]
MALAFRVPLRPAWRWSDLTTDAMADAISTKIAQPLPPEQDRAMLALFVIGMESVAETAVAIGASDGDGGFYVDEDKKRRLVSFCNGLEDIKDWISKDKELSSRVPVPHLSIWRIKKLHTVVVASPTEEDVRIGDYRIQRAWIKQLDGTLSSERVAPEMIREEMELLVAATNSELENVYYAREMGSAAFVVDVAKLAAGFFLEFQAIHPFGDGNGRLGRLLLTYLVSGVTGLHFPLTLLLDVGPTERHLGEASLIGREEWRSLLTRASANAEDLRSVPPARHGQYLSVLTRAGATGSPGELAALIVEGIFVALCRL